ncbi:MAG: amino acid adenylation domain-containing protein, partial [Cyclobacteriaceae bacterium]
MSSGFQLSYQQKRIVELQRNQKGNFDLQASVRVAGNLTASALRSAVTQITEEQAICRTHFKEVSGLTMPVQTISESCVQVYTDKDKSSKIDTPDTGFTVGLIPEGTEGVSLLTIHASSTHADSFSLFRLVREVCDRLVNQVKPKEVLPYIQFSEWQGQLLSEPEEEAVDFWNEYTEGLRLQSAFAFRKALQTSDSGVGIQHEMLDSKWVSAARNWAREAGTDILDLLLATLSLLAGRHNANDGITLGYIHPNRKYDQLHNTVGPLAKTLPVKLRYGNDLSVKELCGSVSEQVAVVTDWAEYFTYEMLSKVSSGLPVFGIGFEFVSVPELPVSGEEIRFEWDTFMGRSDAFEIVFTCILSDDKKMQVNCSYDKACYSDEAASLLLDQYTRLLKEIVHSKPDINTGKVPIGQNIRYSPTPLSTDTLSVDESILSRIENIAKQTPDLPALVCEERVLSYAALSRKANHLARHMADKYSVSAGDRVLIAGERSEWMILSILAVMKLGAVYVPVDPANPAARLSFIAEDAAVKLIVVNSTDTLDLSFAENRPVLRLPVEDVSPETEEGRAMSANASSKAIYCIYTSGTTGQPKGVEISEENLLNYLSWANRYYFNNKKGNNFALFTSLAFDLTVTSIFSTLLRGDTLHIYPENSIDKILRSLLSESSEVNTIKLTPSHIHIIRQLGLDKIAVNTAIVGGEALTEEHVNILRSLNPDIKIYNEYGPTETTVGCIVKEIKDTDEYISIGYPIAETEILLLDDQLNSAAAGIPAELYIGGRGVAAGYLNRPELTAEKFVRVAGRQDETFYRTGDITRWWPDHSLEYIGRSDSQVKRNGYRIELKEIENLALQMEAVRFAVALMVPVEGADPILTLCYGGKEGIRETDLKRQIDKNLPEYMRPSALLYTETLPLTINGKVDTKAIGDLLRQSLNRSEYVPPSTDEQHKITEIWEEILNRDKIGITENFYEAGGHSIRALRIVSRVNDKFNVRLSLEDIIKNPTIKELAACVLNAEQHAYDRIEPVEPQADYPLSYAQKRLWILDQLKTNKVLYNMPMALMFQGELNLDAFDEAIQQIWERHEILRTNFRKVNGEPRQYIKSKGGSFFNAFYQDLRGEDDSLKVAEKLAAKEALHPFDLENDRLFRITFYRVADNRHLVLLNIHHIISDAWSIGLLANEIAILYNSFSNGKGNPLPELPVQYKDYVIWQNSELARNDENSHRTFWHNRLKSLPGKTSFTTDYPRPAVRSLSGSHLVYNFGPDLSKSLMALSRKANTSLFNILSSGLYILLYKLSGETDLIIGTSVAGRDHIDLERQLGFFVNLLALRNTIDEEATYDEMLRQITARNTEAFSHQIYPYDKLVEELGLERGLSHSPLFDILLVLQNTGTADNALRMDGLQVDSHGISVDKCEFDIIFNVLPDEENITINAHYSDELFEGDTILILLEKLKLILDRVSVDNF